MTTPVIQPPAQSHAISELIHFYDRVAADPDRTIPSFGFSIEKVHAKIVIDPDGGNPALEDIRDHPAKGKPTPQAMTLADSGGRSGTSVAPNFLWDNTGYVLGRDNKGKPERAELCFHAFRKLHQSYLERLSDDADYQAVVRFLDQWDPEQAATLDGWDELQGLNVVFQVRRRPGYVHESEAVRDTWADIVRDRSAAQSEVSDGPSLFDGQSKRLARLHPQVQGVVGANTSGAAMVSFNKNAFESYGKSQSYNSPMGEEEAFKYTTALQLLLSDQGRRFRVGDTTVVFWTDAPNSSDDLASQPMFQLFSEPVPPKKDIAEHQSLIRRLKYFLSEASKGIVSERVRSPESNYYLLGLSPSTSRLSIRLWMTGTIQQLAERLQRHLDDLSIDGRDDGRLPFARALAYETARDAKEISPVLSGEILRSILNDQPYPASLLPAIVRRCRVEKNVRPLQAAILKACLNRDLRTRSGGSPIPTALDPSYPSTAYQVGRATATLDVVHHASTGGRIKESAARGRLAGICAKPLINLVPLISLNFHHLSKIPAESAAARRLKVRTRATYAADLEDALSRIDHFPSTLTTGDQARFLIGFYHQNCHTFRPFDPSSAKDSSS